MEYLNYLFYFLIIIAGAKLFGLLSRRFGQSPVIGELLFGVVIGGSLLNLVPDLPIIHFLAEIGVIILLFETGLNSHLNNFLKASGWGLLVAILGVIFPFSFGYGTAILFGMNQLLAIFVGAVLSATSIGITARVFADLKKLKTLEAQIVLGAAVIDDVIGLAILAVVTKMAPVGSSSLGAASLVSGLAIIAAFALGLALSVIKNNDVLENGTKLLSKIFVPVFFVYMGMRVNIAVFNPFVPDGLMIYWLILSLLVVAVIGKALAGFSVWKKGVNRLVIGVGMVPRGEMGLIFANIGLSLAILSSSIYSALVAVIILTTFITPFLLNFFMREQK